jgi:penicillin-binding protein 2
MVITMITRITRIIRMTLLIVLMVVLAFMCVVRLLQIQVVDASLYSGQIKETFTATQSIQAVRGRIIDSEGRILNTNEIVYKIILQRAFLPFGGENEIIAEVLNILIKHDREWLDSLPITLEHNRDRQFQFKNVPGEELDRFKTRLGLNYDATVENCIKALAENYKINTDRYDERMIRFIGGVRYEMELRDFSFQNRYVLAEDICMDIIIELKEKAIILKGVDIIEEPIRVYNDGTSLPHIRGRLNAINQEQYATLKDSGYTLNDVIGFFGIEETMESLLRGENGIREITRDVSWEIISDVITKPVNPGNTVKLTIDTEFQKTVEEILANTINWVNQPGINPRRPWTETTAGSIVVLDVTNGDILSMVNYPTYDLADHVDLMLADAAGEPPLPHQPLLNRGAAHGYRPGSSFKTVTGTAVLVQGAADRSSTVHCTGAYVAFGDWRPRCHSVHGTVNSTRALLESCNIYYYEFSRRMRIDPFLEITNQFGIGTNLNCDISMTAGRMSTPANIEELHNRPFSEGDLIQSAIGQSEVLVTPLHMATIAMMIANNGVRYRPRLVHSVWNYDATELIHEIQPEIAADISEGNEAAFKAVQDGMKSLATDPRNSHLFRFLPDFPAYKTGTPEIISRQLYNSTVLGYYPFESPKIAFAVVLEGGEFSTRAVRNVIDAYFYGHYEPVKDERGNVRTFWEPWTYPHPTAIRGRYND